MPELKELTREVLQESHDETLRGLIWTSIGVKLGETHRSEYMEASKLLDVFKAEAAERGIELESTLNHIAQQIYAQIAVGFWTTEASYEILSAEVLEMLSETTPDSGLDFDLDYARSCLEAAKSTLKDFDLEPEYTYDKYLTESIYNLRKDILRGEILTRAEYLPEEPLDFVISKQLLDHLVEEEKKLSSVSA